MYVGERREKGGEGGGVKTQQQMALHPVPNKIVELVYLSTHGRICPGNCQSVVHLSHGQVGHRTSGVITGRIKNDLEFDQVGGRKKGEEKEREGGLV